MRQTWTPLLVLLLIATSILAATAVISAQIADFSAVVQPLIATAAAAAIGVARIFVR